MNVDKIIYNGKCQTMDNGEVVDWLAIKKDQIFTVGMGNDYEKYAGKDTVLIDAKGCTVSPGFIDSHFHMVQTAVNSYCIDLSNATSFDEIGKLIIREGKKNPEMEMHCIRLDVSKLKEKRFPNRYEIDKYWDKSPVWINNSVYQMSAVNTYGILFYKIPFNMVGVVCDDKQMPTGVFKANANAKLRSNILNSISDFYKQNAIESIMDDLAAKGLTTINAVEGGYMYSDRDAEFINSLINRKDVYLDMELFFQTLDINRIIEMGLKRIGGCLYVDGTFAMRTAAISFEYIDAKGEYGTLQFTQEKLNTFVEECYRRDLQLALYTIGDRAIELAINAHERAVELTGNTSLRHRLEHAELPNKEHIAKARNLGLIFCVQPTYEYYWGGKGGMYESRIGDHYLDTNPFRYMIDQGLMLCAGSDSDVLPCNPLLTLYAATNRNVNKHSITVYEALELITSKGAYAILKENIKGYLKGGYLADIVIFDNDIFSIDKSKLKDVKVVSTIKSGMIVYKDMEYYA
ncbi:MAG TPA: amidohydrolase [Anaerovoracaceae bacterium]|nr:amidohydrolase [Anaerovoracaceae bacterium]